MIIIKWLMMVLKIILFGEMQCVCDLRFKNLFNFFLHKVYYCCSSLPRLSETRRFYKAQVWMSLFGFETLICATLRMLYMHKQLVTLQRQRKIASLDHFNILAVSIVLVCYYHIYIPNPTQYLNLTTTLLTINKLQIRRLRENSYLMVC